MTETRDLAARLAVLNYMGDLVRAEVHATKAKLLARMDEGDRKTATVEVAGQPVDLGTVSRSKATVVAEVVVVDEDELIAWSKTNGHADGIRTIEAMADWKSAELLRHVQTTGEIVPGIDIVERRRSSYVSVRLSPAQSSAIASLRLEEIMQLGLSDQAGRALTGGDDG